MDGSFHLDTDDAVSWLEGLPGGCADLIVLDPGVPGRSARPTSRRGAAPAPRKVEAFPNERLPTLLYEVMRVLAPNKLCWWVCETSQAFLAARAAERLGFSLGAPMVWDRGEQSPVRLGFVLPLTRGRPRSPGAELVVAPRPGVSSSGPGPWPGELPETLCAALIEATTSSGELVIDPFCGAGSFGVAAMLGGRRYLGCDRAPEAIATATARLLGAGGRQVPLEGVLGPTELRDEPAADPAMASPRADRPGRQSQAQLTMFTDGAGLT